MQAVYYIVYFKIVKCIYHYIMTVDISRTILYQASSLGDGSVEFLQIYYYTKVSNNNRQQ